MNARCFKHVPLILLVVALPSVVGHVYGRGSLLPSAQDEKPIEEIVANLAAGRVIVGVFKDGIVIGSIENSVETGSLTPPIVPMNSRRVGVLLGAAEFVSPSSRQVLAKLSHDLPHVRGDAPLSAQQPHLTGTTDILKAGDIEQIGLGLMVRLNENASQIHSQLNFTANEPLTELVLADYIEGYGSEVWFLTYTIGQEPERGDFWNTRVHRPRYVQFWPPEKKAPRTLIEFDYPAEDKSVTLRDMLLTHDARLDKIRLSSPEMAAVADSILRGDLDKILVAAGEPYLRAAIDAIAQGNHEQIGVINFETGFEWIVAPPKEPKPPADKADQGDKPPSLERPADAPTLLKP
ncbi:MAG: hypothetical protein WAK91_04260 [Candidatus Acidiferrales bacterium]|jgi:hypothetical protein